MSRLNLSTLKDGVNELQTFPFILLAVELQLYLILQNVLWSKKKHIVLENMGEQWNVK